MKKIVFIISLIVIVIVTVLGISLWYYSNDQASNKLYSLEELQVVSQNKDYVIAINNNRYAIFIKDENMNKKVKKIAKGKELTKDNIWWLNDRVYIFSSDYASFYRLNDVYEEVVSNTLLFDKKPMVFERILGIEDGWIYYNFVYEESSYTGKIDFDLKEVSIIEKDGIAVD